MHNNRETRSTGMNETSSRSHCIASICYTKVHDHPEKGRQVGSYRLLSNFLPFFLPIFFADFTDLLDPNNKSASGTSEHFHVCRSCRVWTVRQDRTGGEIEPGSLWGPVYQLGPLHAWQDHRHGGRGCQKGEENWGVCIETAEPALASDDKSDQGRFFCDDGRLPQSVG